MSLRLALLVSVAASLLPRFGRAEPLELPHGKITLPLTGLAIDLPKDRRRGFTWSVSASFALSDGGAAYEGRDVIDEKVKGDLLAGTWVMVGAFAAGGCKEILAAVALEEPWTAARDLWKVHFELRGGSFTFDRELGKTPAVAMCAHREGRKDLLLYRFFLDKPEKWNQQSILAALPRLKVLERVTGAWAKDAFLPVEPRRRAEVRDRGQVAPLRKVKLARSGFELTIPDDGFVWLNRPPAEEDAVDWLDRMAPAMPEATLEVARVPGASCSAVLDAITTPKRPDAPPSNVPVGWLAAPSLAVENEGKITIERVICREMGGAAVLVGLFSVPETGPGAGDYGPLAPMLKAIEQAATAMRP